MKVKEAKEQYSHFNAIEVYTPTDKINCTSTKVNRKHFTNYTSYKEISTQDDLYGTILSLLKDNEADPEAIKEKIIFE